MKLSEDLIKEHELSEDVVKSIETFGEEQIASLKKEYDGRANENAEAIITGAAQSVVKKFGLDVDRQQGQKLADYIGLVSEKAVETKQQEIDRLKGEYEEKIKGVKGSEAISKEYESLKQKLDEVQKRYADYDEVKSKAEEYDGLSQKYSGMKKQSAFGSVKPSFPDTVNEYEARAKWNDFVKSVEETYNIDLDDGEPIAVDKENPHRVKKLKDLVSENEAIQELLKGRQQGGLSGAGKEKDGVEIEGVPFTVPKGATSKERTEAIRQYLEKQGIDKMNPNYSVKFAELNKKILSANK